MEKKEKETPTGHTCKCGEYYKWPTYVYAHWDENLKHTCKECGRRVRILRGVVT